MAEPRRIGPQPSPRTASPAVRELFGAIDRSGLTYGEIARRGGTSGGTMSRWKHGAAAPRLTDFEAIAQVLGLRVILAGPADPGSAP